MKAASLDSLPREILEPIFQLVYANEEDGYRRCSWEFPLVPGSAKPRPMLARDLLTPLHISSWIRQVNLVNYPLWSHLAEIVLSVSTGRAWQGRRARTGDFLMFCSERARTLQRIDLHAGSVCECKWASDLLPLLGAVEASAVSAKHLRLHDLFGARPFWCHCMERHSAYREPVTRPKVIQEVWTRLFNLLYQMDSLESLEAEMPNELPDPNDLVVPSVDLQARPKQLHLKMYHRQPVSERLHSFLCTLASRVVKLQLHLDTGRYYWPEGPPSSARRVLHSILEGATATMEELQIYRGTDERLQWSVPLFLAAKDFKVLKKLYVSNQAPVWVPRPLRELNRSYLPSLSSIEVPASLLYHIEVPNVQTAVLTLHNADEDEFVIWGLRQWDYLTDLVLYCDGSTKTHTKNIMLNNIIDELIPDEEDLTVSCPNLERLSVLCRHLETKYHLKTNDSSLLETAFIHPRLLPNSNSKRKSWDYVPYLSSDFSLLARARWELSEGSSKYASFINCRPLKMIRVVDCLVDKERWRRLVREKRCVDAWCWPEVPDPLFQAPIRSRRATISEGGPVGFIVDL